MNFGISAILNRKSLQDFINMLIAQKGTMSDKDLVEITIVGDTILIDRDNIKSIIKLEDQR